MKQTPKKTHEWTNEEREALDEMYDPHFIPMINVISEEELRLMEEEENRKRRRRTPHEL